MQELDRPATDEDVRTWCYDTFTQVVQRGVKLVSVKKWSSPGKPGVAMVNVALAHTHQSHHTISTNRMSDVTSIVTLAKSDADDEFEELDERLLIPVACNSAQSSGQRNEWFDYNPESNPGKPDPKFPDGGVIHCPLTRLCMNMILSGCNYGVLTTGERTFLAKFAEGEKQTVYITRAFDPTKPSHEHANGMSLAQALLHLHGMAIFEKIDHVHQHGMFRPNFAWLDEDNASVRAMADFHVQAQSDEEVLAISKARTTEKGALTEEQAEKEHFGKTEPKVSTDAKDKDDAMADSESPEKNIDTTKKPEAEGDDASAAPCGAADKSESEHTTDDTPLPKVQEESVTASSHNKINKGDDEDMGTVLEHTPIPLSELDQRFPRYWTHGTAILSVEGCGISEEMVAGYRCYVKTVTENAITEAAKLRQEGRMYALAHGLQGSVLPRLVFAGSCESLSLRVVVITQEGFDLSSDRGREIIRSNEPAGPVLVAKQCRAGLVALHEHGILHGSVSPKNILVDENMKVKFIDLGQAERLDVKFDNDEDRKKACDREIALLNTVLITKYPQLIPLIMSSA